MRLYFLTKKSLKASSHDSKLGFEEGSYSMTLLVVVAGPPRLARPLRPRPCLDFAE